MWWNLILLAGGGAAGTLARVGLSAWVNRQAAGPVAWGTVTVNLAGCLLFGLVWAFLDRRDLLASPWPVLLLAGFMGAFTTFSTFAFDVAQTLRGAHPAAAALNLVLQNVGGVTLLLVGLWLGRRLAGG